MKILLVGGHTKLSYLAKLLKSSGHDVTIVNADKQLCEMLSDSHEVFAICGDGTKSSVLESANAAKMDAVIALTGNDASNLIICEISKKQFNIKTTLSIVNNPQNINMFKELGVDKCISAIQIFADFIEQM
ncbi:Trk system potassium uptake protein TrkA [bioreactor metagenome]|jgi:trk system potassium uptake protein TrkA|uniref:Trk system potassium uptake protein TrkA n=2 Tax=root TaxID=1 RepID=A0A562JK54_9FIRM|nr:TrkA family potassium uptake protein [Sedimentibacter saalensis]TWH83581.1 trk system potassium uptake protein TrkA [Sedimentibacter saalensis]